MIRKACIFLFITFVSYQGCVQSATSECSITINGGYDFNQYIKDSLQWVIDSPGDAQVLVHVSFYIDTVGLIHDLHVESICEPCNKEVERFVQSVDFWDPIIIDKKPTNSKIYFDIPYWIWTHEDESNIRHLEIVKYEF